MFSKRCSANAVQQTLFSVWLTYAALGGVEDVLDVRDLRMRYGETGVLDGVSFAARRGEVLARPGPAGAGKTTRIEILEGFRVRSAGRVSVLGAGLTIGSPGRWLTLAWVLVLGLLATLPPGAALGSLFPSQRSAGPRCVLLLTGLAAISGIFHPITHLPVFPQRTGQAFPPYRLGLGMRSALPPNAMAAAEVGHSRRHLTTFGVLSARAVAGLVLAPAVLRPMTRRQSGSAIAARREKAMHGT
jgi:energy-coupling factor transporter ATP-binding protein EcfA2